MHPPVLRVLTAARAATRVTAVVLLAAQSLVAHGLTVHSLAQHGLVAAAADAVAAGDALWEVKPAANIFGPDRPSYSYTLPRGGQLRDSLVIVNRGKTPLVLSLYGADAFTSDAGRLDLLGKDAKSQDVGAWVQLDRTTVRVAPGRSVDVPFRLALPDSAAPGDHLGGIVTGTANSRQAIKIRLRVSGELKPGLTVENLKVHYTGTPNPLGTGSATVTYTLRNTGNAIIAARQAASVAGPFGAFAAHPAQLVDSPQLLPGETWQIAAPIHGVPPALRLTGTVTVVPLLKTTPLAATETALAASSTSQTPSSATTHAVAIPWSLLLLLAAGATITAFLITRHRHRPRPAHAR
ncbi:hypothetical protein [Kribbella catacumbae]|uniref:hypothetical protein n=1 Tax=Kribbella catacumbae TaxID=460086 RepID=UPI0003774475|nr:hypothetical protein [Kribbella catacumbae]